MTSNWKRDYELKRLRESIDALEAHIIKYEQIAQEIRKIQIEGEKK